MHCDKKRRAIDTASHDDPHIDLIGTIVVVTDVNSDMVFAFNADEYEYNSHNTIATCKLRELWRKNIRSPDGVVVDNDLIYVAENIFEDHASVQILNVFDGTLLKQVHIKAGEEILRPISMAVGYMQAPERIHEALRGVRELYSFPPGLLPLCVSYLTERVIAVACRQGVALLESGRLIQHKKLPLGNFCYIAIDPQGIVHTVSLSCRATAFDFKNDTYYDAQWTDGHAGAYRGLAIDSQGRVVFGQHHELYCYNANRTLAWTDKRHGYIADVVSDMHGNIFVAETESDLTRQITAFSNAGKAVAVFRLSGAKHEARQSWRIAVAPKKIKMQEYK